METIGIGATFEATGGLALTSTTTYTEAQAEQGAVLLQAVSNGEQGTGPTLSASVGPSISTSAPISPTRPAPSSVRFELAGDGVGFWRDGVLGGGPALLHILEANEVPN